MVNYWSYLIGAFLALVFAFVSAFYTMWSTVPFLLFSGWLFRKMHFSGQECMQDSGPFVIPGLKELLSNSHLPKMPDDD